MKKTLLLFTAALGSVSVIAQPLENPCFIENATAQFLSPNGKYMVSNAYEDLSVIDLETGQRWDYTAYDAMGNFSGYSYRVGTGNIISDTGVVLASNSMDTNAAYWKEGKWYTLNTAGCVGVSLCNGITPDGSRICGSLNLIQPGFSSETMQLPVYWDAEGDSYGKYHLLPCPTSDFTGRPAQYITAVTISDDGKTISGQVHDYSGKFNEPIIYTQDENGEWSYTLLMEKDFRPEGAEWPKYPEDLPNSPNATDYMTDDMRNSYNQAMNDWAAGGYNPDLYPEMADYLTPEAIAEYNEAVDEWNALAEEYNRKVMEFFTVFEEFTAKLPAFQYNSSKITPDGKKVASTLTMLEDPNDFWSAQLTFPARIDVATGEYEVIGNMNNLSVWSVLADGRITASTPVVDGNLLGYIETEDGELVSIYDYINNLRPDYGAWMKENMTHTVAVDYDPETYAPIYDELLISGAALASRDAGKIVTWTTNTWDYDSPVQYYTYYFDMNATNSVGNATADSLKAEVVGCEVYDLYGRRVLQTTEKNSVKNAALAKGVYLVKTILSNGESTTEKMSF